MKFKKKSIEKINKAKTWFFEKLIIFVNVYVDLPLSPSKRGKTLKERRPKSVI